MPSIWARRRCTICHRTFRYMISDGDDDCGPELCPRCDAIQSSDKVRDPDFNERLRDGFRAMGADDE